MARIFEMQANQPSLSTLSANSEQDVQYSGNDQPIERREAKDVVGVGHLLSQILPDEQRRARVLGFVALPTSSHQIWFGTGGNGKSLLASLVKRVAPSIKVVEDVTNLNDSIKSVPLGACAIIITNLLDDYKVDDSTVVHFDQKLNGFGSIDLDARSVAEEFLTILSNYRVQSSKI